MSIRPAAIRQPEPATKQNHTNIRLFPRPTQLFTNPQWWSRFVTQALHCPQWVAIYYGHIWSLESAVASCACIQQRGISILLSRGIDYSVIGVSRGVGARGPCSGNTFLSSRHVALLSPEAVQGGSSASALARTDRKTVVSLSGPFRGPYSTILRMRVAEVLPNIHDLVAMVAIDMCQGFVA